ncbi:SprB repeat-containing protein, partial [Flavobacteriales bacterium]|nr:SprB repeat-containing protein [Flavobacteriales bacterium]
MKKLLLLTFNFLYVFISIETKGQTTPIIDSILITNNIDCNGELADIMIYVDNDTNSLGCFPNCGPLVSYQVKGFTAVTFGVASAFASSITTGSSIPVNGTNEGTYYVIIVDSLSFVTAFPPSQQFFSNGTPWSTVLAHPSVYDVDTIVLTAPQELSNSLFTQTTNQCFGDCNASELVSISGGTLPYFVNLVPIYATDTLFENLCAGTYNYTVTDVNGCQLSSSSPTEINIIQPPDFSVNGSVTSDYNGQDISCYGASDGELTGLVVSGTNAPYEYSLDNFNWVSNPVFSGLSAGSYNIYYRDINLCLNDETLTLNQPPDFSISSTFINPSPILNDGEISLFVSGGVSPYTYLWTNGSTLPNVSGLSAGTYNCTITDDNGCSEFITFSLSSTIISNDTAVCDSFNGSLYALGAELSGITADDGHSGVVDLGFTFNFYGQSYNQIVISGNGYLTFDLSQANQYSPYSINTPIPNPGSMPENAIMCPWQDMNSGIGGNITYETVGVAPNRKFIVTWCGVPMFSCTSLLHTSQVVLYETSDKIEMFLENKPVCSQFNGGNAVQGLVDATSTFFDIVVDPPSVLPRNFPLQWVAVNEAWEFLPNHPANSYQINPIAYIPVIAGQNIWSNANGDILGFGSTLSVNISSTNTYFANYNGDCTTSSSYDSITIIVNYCGCTDPLASNYDFNANTDDGSCTYSTVCSEPIPTGLFASNIVHNRATINWDNMNDANCTVDQYRIK